MDLEPTREKLTVVDHDPEWLRIFEMLKRVYKEHLGELIIRVEHVGSTAVPGLCAKPCIDIDIVIEDYSKLPTIIEKLSELGYSYEGDQGIRGREAFKRADAKVPWDGTHTRKMDHHLYVCPKKSEELKKHITFRDYMKEHPEFKEEYCRLKKNLALKHREDRITYTEAKTTFIETVLERARLEK